MLVILAAGKGSRSKMPEGRSKCSVNIGTDACPETTISRLIKQFKMKEVCIVLGYGAQSVVESLNSVNGLSSYSISYIYNPYYDKFGCEYSLSCAYRFFSLNEGVILVEGDLVLSDKNANQMKNSSGTSVLCRPDSYLSSKSVAVLPTPGPNYLVSQFVYDQSHQLDFGCVSKSIVMKDSMQVWKFSPHAANIMRDCLKYYKRDCDQHIQNTPLGYGQESGVSTLNSLVSNSSSGLEMEIVMSCHPQGWMNLNTPEDFNKFKEVEWR